ncbi:MAG: hypothetical protein EBU76_11690, partial [Gammaproteobacteria bacterium]|nr:hypothetical protein [Gammaproteobacteria bacterium]
MPTPPIDTVPRLPKVRTRRSRRQRSKPYGRAVGMHRKNQAFSTSCCVVLAANKTMPVQRKSQRGSALLLIVISAVTLIGIVGLALDASHLGYMKARLQSTVDAMALAAAKRLDETGSTTSACEAARTTLLENAEGFREL